MVLTKDIEKRMIKIVWYKLSQTRHRSEHHS